MFPWELLLIGGGIFAILAQYDPLGSNHSRHSSKQRSIRHDLHGVSSAQQGLERWELNQAAQGLRRNVPGNSYNDEQLRTVTRNKHNMALQPQFLQAYTSMRQRDRRRRPYVLDQFAIHRQSTVRQTSTEGTRHVGVAQGLSPLSQGGLPVQTRVRFEDSRFSVPKSFKI